jgi:hypothetical protein
VNAKQRADSVGKFALIVAFFAPIIVFVGAMVTRFGMVSYEVGFHLIAVLAGGVMALAATAFALVALLLSFADFKRFGGRALIALLIAGVTLAGHVRFQLQARAAPPIHDVATRWDEPVTLSKELLALRKGAANPVEDDPHVPTGVGPPWGGMRVADVNAKTCPGAKSIPHGVDPDQAAQVLKDNGVEVRGSAVFRVEGIYQGFWFGATDDVAVDIRPERTDIRSIRREGLSDYGANCARVTKIVQALSK